MSKRKQNTETNHINITPSILREIAKHSSDFEISNGKNELEELQKQDIEARVNIWNKWRGHSSILINELNQRVKEIINGQSAQVQKYLNQPPLAKASVLNEKTFTIEKFEQNYKLKAVKLSIEKEKIVGVVDIQPVLPRDVLNYRLTQIKNGGVTSKITSKVGLEIKLIQVGENEYVLLDGQRRLLADVDKISGLVYRSDTPFVLFQLAIEAWNKNSILSGNVSYFKSAFYLAELKKYKNCKNEDLVQLYFDKYGVNLKPDQIGKRLRALALPLEIQEVIEDFVYLKNVNIPEYFILALLKVTELERAKHYVQSFATESNKVTKQTLANFIENWDKTFEPPRKIQKLIEIEEEDDTTVLPPNEDDLTNEMKLEELNRLYNLYHEKKNYSKLKEVMEEISRIEEEESKKWEEKQMELIEKPIEIDMDRIWKKYEEEMIHSGKNSTSLEVIEDDNGQLWVPLEKTPFSKTSLKDFALQIKKNNFKKIHIKF